MLTKTEARILIAIVEGRERRIPGVASEDVASLRARGLLHHGKVTPLGRRTLGEWAGVYRG